ncbi:DUF2524 family protein [Bacillus sp. FJAT-45350]|uniref:DUF2524 family protein n=1 Tax=Bacillus sp. FJAT-45350 TaxID=2011014 RepID=UPI000BB6CE4C|nr:DUF2524 family protein [Bacillus sp. FJAT-45350]
MATHKQIIEYMQKATETMEFAEEQLMESHRVQQGDPVQYSQAQQSLNEIDEELDNIYRSATPEQKADLERYRQQIREIQNQMVLKR